MKVKVKNRMTEEARRKVGERVLSELSRRMITIGYRYQDENDYREFQVYGWLHQILNTAMELCKITGPEASDCMHSVTVTDGDVRIVYRFNRSTRLVEADSSY